MEDSGDETDASGHSETAILNGAAVTQSTDKKFGTYSRYFSGSTGSSYFTISDNVDNSGLSFNGATQAYSVVFWMKSDSISGYYGIINKYHSTSYGSSWSIARNTTYITTKKSIYSSAASFITQNSSSGTIAANTWYHIAITYNGTNSYKIYIDGVLVATNDASSKPGVHNGNLQTFIGCARSGSSGDPVIPTSYFKGYLDDLAVFKRELSSSEITDILTNGLIGTGETITRRKGVLFD